MQNQRTRSTTEVMSVAGITCDRCPFGLLREHTNRANPRDCRACNLVTEASLAGLYQQARRLAQRNGVRDWSFPDDVVNELVINIVGKGLHEKYDKEQGPAGPFVRGINWRTFQSLYRKARKFRSLPETLDVPDDRGNPVTESAKAEVQEIVRAAVAQLPPRYRHAICHAYGIPDVTEPTQGVTRNQEPCKDMILFRARRRLRAILQKLYPDILSLF